MILLELFTSFFKIGLFSFGGGYAMIPLISEEIIRNGWMSEVEFIQIIGIAEMTPGPIAVNSATFVGYKTAGVIGSVAATFGVALPSLLIIIFVSGFFFKYKKHPLMKKVFYGIRPVVAGLVLAAAIVIAKTTLIASGHDASHVVNEGLSLGMINFKTIAILVMLYFIEKKKKLHPIMLIVIAGALGYISSFI